MEDKNKNQDPNKSGRKEPDKSLDNLSEEEIKRIIEERAKSAEPINPEASVGDESSGQIQKPKEPSSSDINDDIKNDPYLKSAKKIEDITGKKGLGKVKMGPDEGPTSDEILGWHSLFVEDLPSRGLFYPRDCKMQIRAARVEEIRQFSTMEERDLFDVDDKLNLILRNCLKIKTGDRVLSWKDLLEEDRVYAILAIRDLTFKEGENKLQIKKQCPECGHENKKDINNQIWSFNKIPEDVMKYYSEEERCFVIRTKSYGEFRMKPPTIGVMQVVTEYIRDKQQNNEFWDKSYIQILPYTTLDHRGFNSKSIFDGEVEFKGWDEKKYLIHYRMAEKIKVGVKPEVEFPCAECGAEVTAPVSFPDGVKSLFIVSDISDELL